MNLPDGYFLQRKKYRLTRTIGQGGFGITYLGVWNTEVKGELGAMKTNVQVCIKEYFFKDYCYREKDSCSVKVHSLTGEKLFSKFKEKLIEEANILSAVHHPHIVNVLEVFEENNTAYIVMEYIKGCSLKYMLDKEGTLPENKVIKYTHQIGNALDFVHKKNVVHLDIKPGNILIDGEDNARLIDFGVSKRYDIEEQETSTTTLTLSKGFAAIEQYDTEGMQNFSPCPDIYSLGATMYNLLTGVVPVESILRVTKKMLPPSAFNSNVSSKTEKAILKAMAVNPEDRFQSVKEMLATIDAPDYELSENKLVESNQPDEEDGTEVLSSDNPDDFNDETVLKNSASTSDTKSRKRKKRKKKTRRRLFMAAAILFFAFVGYATYCYYYDKPTFQRLLTAVNFAKIIAQTDDPPPFNPLSNKDEESEQNPSDVKSDTESSSETESGTKTEPESDTVIPEQQGSTQTSTTAANQQMPPNRNGVSNTPQGANNTQTNSPAYSAAEIETVEKEFRRLETSVKEKLAAKNYYGAKADIDSAEIKATMLARMGKPRDMSELRGYRDICVIQIDRQAIEARLANYRTFDSFGNWTIARHKESQKYGAIDDLGIEQIPCIYRQVNRISGMENLRQFIKEDGSVDTYDKDGQMVILN